MTCRRQLFSFKLAAKAHEETLHDAQRSKESEASISGKMLPHKENVLRNNDLPLNRTHNGNQVFQGSAKVVDKYQAERWSY